MPVFFGGVPTKMDVDRLLKGIEVGPGTEVPFSRIDEIIGKISLSRFNSITSAWRKQIFRNQLIQSTRWGGAFHFLTADEALGHGRQHIRKIGRATGRLDVRLAAVDTNQLSGGGRDLHTLMRRETQAMLEVARTAQKTLAAPKAVSGATLRLAKNG